MRVWTSIKLLATLGVLAVMTFTGMLAYHIVVAPLGGIFEKIIPDPAEVVGNQLEADFTKKFESVEMPDIDPGEKAFQKALELLAVGDISEAREKLTAIVSVFPGSSRAPSARRIVGEMNLDEILSTSYMEGKQTHIVKPGNSYLGIAAEYRTTLDCIIHLNGMLDLKGIQPGNEFLVMPLDFRLLIEPQRKAISVWDGGRFICEYPILYIETTPKLAAGKSTITAKRAEFDGRQVPPQSKDYRAASKIIQIAPHSTQIRAADESDKLAPHGIVLQPQDMEELSLLTRLGNQVEIR